ncbi:MAG: 4-hydroxythreonine-4-phosphate dehydrogenase PdxA [Bryobacterales bacterium]|nr:4-hydroxythreonine-4-phosphate dehydrogenase PdxA [Bryobacterales bacterium]
MEMIFGITMGDASGVGPEILLKAYAAGELRHPVVAFGDQQLHERGNREVGLGVPLREVDSPQEYQPGALNVRDLARLRADEVRIGQVDPRSGAAARDYVVEATQAALKGEIAAIVTLPINKEATQASDPSFTGHTELIGELCGARDVTIMLASDELIVTHVTTHMSLRRALEEIRRERVLRVIEMTCEAVARLRPQPRVAVAGLNPHAGENGLFGREEIEEIAPAVEQARRQGLPVEGPVPPDTVFYLAARRKRYEAVVAMYHDQGHIPLKLLDFEGGVNVTLGLPIIRTSVDHGTAFDIAWKGIASTRSLVRALEMAVRLAGLKSAST